LLRKDIVKRMRSRPSRCCDAKAESGAGKRTVRRYVGAVSSDRAKRTAPSQTAAPRGQAIATACDAFVASAVTTPSAPVDVRSTDYGCIHVTSRPRSASSGGAPSRSAVGRTSAPSSQRSWCEGVMSVSVPDQVTLHVVGSGQSASRSAAGFETELIIVGPPSVPMSTAAMKRMS
jgi:hypothetical protein